MPRAPRDTAAGVFHVTTHSVRDTALFRDDIDRLHFLEELARVTADRDWVCLGYCLMRTHYHLLLDVIEGGLPRGMKRLNFRYAAAFNARHRLRGHVTERRYWAGRIRNDGHLLAAYRYVMRNPVTAGVADDPSGWPWSSYGQLDAARGFCDPSLIQGVFGGSTPAAVAALRDFVDEP